MKRTLILALATLFVGSLGLAPSAFATVPPTLSLEATGSGDQVQINVTGDPNESVILSYNETGVGPTLTSLGSTNGNDSFSTTVSSGTYGLTSGTPVTVFIGGTNGPESASESWPSVTATNSLTLSQNAVVLNVGSSLGISASNLGSGALYVSNNSNPSIANVSISGSSATISGNTAGSTTITLCEVGAASNCPNVYVTVEQSGASQLSFSQNNVSVVEGQDIPVTISGGNGVYQILNNSNSSVIQASINGSVLTMSTGSVSGSSSITVCSSDLSTCGIVVATAGSSSSVDLSFSSSAPVLSTNQSSTINIYGPSGVQFYVSSNSNPSVVQANLSGTTLTLTGITSGSSTISVCASTGTCASLTATVEYTASGGNITLSQNTLSLLAGQNTSVTISGGEAPYTTSGGTSTVSQETLNSNILTVYGIATGASSIDVCSAGGGCAVLTVSVNGGTSATTMVVPTTTVAPTATVSATPAYTFTEYLAPGSEDEQVTELQQVLAAQGDFSATATGYFGDETENAVIAFQAAHGIDQLGVVGPATRAALNQIESSGASASVSTTDVSTMTLSQLQAEVTSLEAQLTQVLNRIAQLSG